MIRKATLDDIEVVLQITRACARHMIQQNIFQWNEFYPNASVFINDVKQDELYVLENNRVVVGCITISKFMDNEYKSVKWLTPNTNNIYIHRLAVNPKFQGQGFAQKLMNYAEVFSIKNNYPSIRLDTFSQNKKNQKFYELRGYKKLGDIYFPKQSDYPFYCYELIL